MTDNQITNLPASVHQRLLNRSKEQGENFNQLLTRFALERLLYRLARSGHAQAFILKGALVFNAWGISGLSRPTRDLDLLGYGDPSAQHLEAVFRAICTGEVEPDGLAFDPESVHVQPIREAQEYGGMRVGLTARLGTARLPLQVDIGFGDIVVPDAAQVAFPTLLDFPAPILRVYSQESVIAEKLHAMVVLGRLNSRMKDFYDLWLISQVCDVDGERLCRAVGATFERRNTQLPVALPVPLTDDFARDRDKVLQWDSFLQRSRLDVGELYFQDVVTDLRSFLVPPLSALAGHLPFRSAWSPHGPWHVR